MWINSDLHPSSTSDLILHIKKPQKNVCQSLGTGRIGCVRGAWGVWEVGVGDFGHGMGSRYALLSRYLGKSGHLPRFSQVLNVLIMLITLRKREMKNWRFASVLSLLNVLIMLITLWKREVKNCSFSRVLIALIMLITPRKKGKSKIEAFLESWSSSSCWSPSEKGKWKLGGFHKSWKSWSCWSSPEKGRWKIGGLLLY